VVFGGATVRKNIESLADALEFADCTEAAQAGPGGLGIEIPGAQNPDLPDQFEDFVILCRLSSHGKWRYIKSGIM